MTIPDAPLNWNNSEATAWQHGYESGLNAAQARIMALEVDLERALAERDIWRERAGWTYHDEHQVIMWPDPTPAEIAARMEQKRKERGG